MRNLLYILCSFCIFHFSCEDVIDIDLNSVEPRIVIEAKLFDQIFPATVVITKTSDFFDSISFNTVSDAEVYISDDNGNVYTLSETDTAGFYQADIFGEIGRTYTLEVTVEGQTYKASAEMKSPLKIDSVKAKYHNAEFPYDTSGYELSCYIGDSINVNEYCLLNVYRNFKKSNYFYLYDDTYTDGSSFEYIFFPETFQEGDTAIIEIQTCDKGVYDYLYTYAEITGEFYPDSGTPYNPTSNISNSALGYFGIFSLNGALMFIGNDKILNINSQKGR